MSVKNGVIPPQAVRVLTAMAWLQEQGRPITFRRLQRALGLKSINSISYSLKVLFDTGLITAEADSYGGKQRGAGTLRPTCCFVPVDQLKACHDQETAGR